MIFHKQIDKYMATQISSNWQYLNKLATLILLLSIALLSACASTDENNDDETKNWSAKKFYKEAMRELKAGDYELAIEYFETLEARFPFGKFAKQAQLQTAYAYYKFDEPDSAIVAADRFIKLYPTHAKIDYAYYLRGLASFHKKDTPFDSIVEQDPSERDPGSAREAFNYFAQLVRQFPKSQYVADSIKRMEFLRNTLAQHELNVASYYIKRRAYIAAINRAKYVVENYPKTPAIPNALLTLNQAYNKLRMHELANDIEQVLKLNYPDLLLQKPTGKQY